MWPAMDAIAHSGQRYLRMSEVFASSPISAHDFDNSSDKYWKKSPCYAWRWYSLLIVPTQVLKSNGQHIRTCSGVVWCLPVDFVTHTTYYTYTRQPNEYSTGTSLLHSNTTVSMCCWCKIKKCKKHQHNSHACGCVCAYVRCPMKCDAWHVIKSPSLCRTHTHKCLKYISLGWGDFNSAIEMKIMWWIRSFSLSLTPSLSLGLCSCAVRSIQFENMESLSSIEMSDWKAIMWRRPHLIEYAYAETHRILLSLKIHTEISRAVEIVAIVSRKRGLEISRMCPRRSNAVQGTFQNRSCERQVTLRGSECMGNL